jgi:acetyltransferase
VTPQALERWRTRDGFEVVIRPSLPGDESAWVDFVRGLSPATRYKRGGTRLEALTQEVAHERVAPDPAREFALLALAGRADSSAIVGVARSVRRGDTSWEFMLVVADAW